MEKTLLLLGWARENSTRLPYKMIRSFNDTTLYEIYLRKFEEISKMNHSFNDIAMAIGKMDSVLWELSSNFEIKIIKRNEYSVNSPSKINLSKFLHYLKNFKNSHIMWVNGCFPFLESKTILKIAEFFKRDNNLISLHCVKKRLNWFWDYETKLPINNLDSKNVGTQDSPPLFESVHCIHIFPRDRVLEEGIFWKYELNDPFLYEVNSESIEFLDIDTKLDFDIAKGISNVYRT